MEQRLWIVLLGACALSLAGSVWAVLVRFECDSCRSAAALLKGFDLAALGIAYYLHLLLVLVLKGRSRYAFSCILGAAGVHLPLVAWLLIKQHVCIPCLVTAFGAFAMTGAALAVSPRSYRRLVVVIPLTAALAVGGKLLLRSLQPDPEAAAQRQVRLALQREEKDPPVPRGTVRVQIYSRPTCKHCRHLDQQVMPIIRREFDAALRVEHRPAWKGLPTPTLIIRGEKRTHLIGVRGVEALRAAIRFARGSAGTRLSAAQGHR
jgi:hypothetical protein